MTNIYIYLLIYFSPAFFKLFISLIFLLIEHSKLANLYEENYHINSMSNPLKRT